MPDSLPSTYRPDPAHFINRELSWLEFNQRVLDQAMDEMQPLLERVKFLAITGSNLDEFFQVRVGGLKMLAASRPDRLDVTGLTADQQLDLIRARVRSMYHEQAACFHDHLEPELAEANIRRLKPDSLSPEQQSYVKDYLRNEFTSETTPIAVGSSLRFPMLGSARFCLCVRRPETARLPIPNSGLGGDSADLSEATSSGNGSGADSETESGAPFVVIPFHKAMRRIIALPTRDGFDYVLAEDAVREFISEVVPAATPDDVSVFRITRNADVAIDDDASDLLAEMKGLLDKRKTAACVRLEIVHDSPRDAVRFLQQTLGVGDADTYRIRGPIDLNGLFELYGIPGFNEYRDEPWPPQPSPDFTAVEDPFELMANGDRILLHPYQTFDHITEVIRCAANDPNVIAIKQTLYRTAKDSQIVEALISAAEQGKHVTVVVELKARFDEANNIRAAEKLEHAGCDVIYGVQGLKTHAKICIVVRREDRGLQRYVHFGTGNYNESTARLYSDVSLFTNHTGLGTDAIHFFNAISGLSVPQDMEWLAMSPIDCRDTLLDMIRAEAEHSAKGGHGEINVKVNSLVDEKLISELYEASMKGVQIRLNVRGICCLRPGLPGISENILVTSIVDRMLEHARIFHFHHAGDDLVYISSADWMPRNLDRRIELLVPVVDKECKARALHILDTYFRDNVKARRLNADGQYEPVAAEGPPFRAQEVLYREACDMYAAFANPKATVFKAHRGESA